MIVPHQKAHPKTLENSGSSTVHAVDAARKLFKDETKDGTLNSVCLQVSQVVHFLLSSVCVYF